MKVFVSILAGGKGERFWPKSRQSRPKQFVELVGEGTLFSQAVERAKKLVPVERILVLTNRNYINYVKSEGIPEENILAEPVGKNTAPSCAWGAWVGKNRWGEDAVNLVMPSDHYITGDFEKTVRRAVEAAAQGYLVTFGIVPTRPETGYGYIKPMNQIMEDVYKVERFVEKPDFETAKKYVKEGYLWNSGMFVWKVGVFLEEVEKHAPAIASTLPLVDENLEAAFYSFPSISVDYAIMEKTERAAVVRALFNWSDLGNWVSVGEYLEKADGNRVKGRTLFVDSEDNIVFNETDRMVALVGVKDMVVVVVEDAVLVVPKNMVQRVRGVITALKEKGLDKWL